MFCFNINISKTVEPPFTSAIVVNSNKGEILYSYNIDNLIYPASLTKMMTAYIVFDAISNGVIGLKDEIEYSKYSKYNLYEIFGTTKQITIKDLLLKMIVNSSNDCADILAMEITGDINAFIELMNKTAQEFNMKNTHFNNATGLFDEQNYSTARDIANLSIKLVNDFPSYTEFFGITDYMSKDNEFDEKTTTIQRNLRGIKGSKTGYLSASGYNIAVWGEYNKKNIFTIVIGAKDKTSRDKLVLQLLNESIHEDFDTKQQIINDNEELSQFLTFIGLDPLKYLSTTPIKRTKPLYLLLNRDKVKKQKTTKENDLSNIPDYENWEIENNKKDDENDDNLKYKNNDKKTNKNNRFYMNVI